VDNGRLQIERRSTSDAPPGDITVTDPDGKEQKLALNAKEPGRGSASLPATLPGVWQVSDGTRRAFAAAGAADPVEIADLRATATVLQPLIRASGGSAHWLDPNGAPELRMVEPDHETSGAGWIGFERRHDHLVTGIAATPLLPSWAALPLILGLAVLAWRREGA